MKRLLILSLIFTFITAISFGQKKVKYGKVDKADLEMTHYPSDSSANAAILYDNGYTDLEYHTGIGEFRVSFERHLRIKIFDKSGIDWADFKIPIYESGGDREKIANFKATTYTLTNGKVIENSVKKKDLLTEELSENRSVAKIAMPNVQEGSIIEIEYSVSSPFYWNLWDWQYQYSIPVRYSEYRINYPEWFQYNTQFKGYDLQYITPLEIAHDQNSIMFSSVNRSSGYVAKSTHVNNKVDYKRMRFGWIAENMPAFVKEAYSTSVDNFLVKVKFELGSTNFPGSPWKSYTQTWPDINTTILEFDNFGKQLSKGKTKFLNNTVKSITASATNEKDKIGALFFHTRKKFNWTGRESKYVSSSLKEAYENGKGNAADINMCLIAMLRIAGLEADPVLLSTRDHGFLNKAFPTMSQFNYVIAGVKMADGKLLLLDATDKDLPINLLPLRCINEQGLIVKPKTANWVNLTPNGKYHFSRSCVLKLNEDKKWEGKMKIRRKDYAADRIRYNYRTKENEAAYIESIESNHEGMAIANFSIEGLDKLGKGVSESCKVNFESQLMDAGDLLYFNPMLTFGVSENPFKLEERTYPIDYGYPESITQSFQFEIPEGYTVDDLPEKAVISLPEKGGMFSYSVKHQGNQIIVLSQLKIKKHLFLPVEYQSLKEFYNIIVEKHSGQVVLKKV